MEIILQIRIFNFLKKKKKFRARIEWKRQQDHKVAWLLKVIKDIICMDGLCWTCLEGLKNVLSVTTKIRKIKKIFN